MNNLSQWRTELPPTFLSLGVLEWPEGAKDSSMRGGHTIIATVKEKVTFYFQRCMSAQQREILNEIKTNKNLQERNNQCFPKGA